MRTSLTLIALAMGSFAAIPCLASSIDLGFTGVANVGSNFIDFGASPTAGPFVSEPNYGSFTVTEPVQGVFASTGVKSGDSGQIESLTMGAPASPFVQPFIKFSTSNVILDLSTVNQGSTVGPFNLADTASGATASFSVNGTLWNSATNTELGQYVGVFSATFANTTVAQLEAQSVTGVQTAFSATISTSPVSAVPEPASLALLGLGLLGLGIFTRKRVAHRS
ncbi:MAG TPA: PEP-CTERM sorting domain-containing protein [Bryobacteraceae bacterium]